MTAIHLIIKYTLRFSCLYACFFHFDSLSAQTPIDLSHPVGMTTGAAGSNGSGAATYSIPINIPAGVKEVQPVVGLTYSSQGGGNGYSGHGWVLSPISMIARSGKKYLSRWLCYTG